MADPVPRRRRRLRQERTGSSPAGPQPDAGTGPAAGSSALSGTTSQPGTADQLDGAGRGSAAGAGPGPEALGAGPANPRASSVEVSNGELPDGELPDGGPASGEASGPEASAKPSPADLAAITTPVHDPDEEGGTRPTDDREAERGLRGLVGGGSSQVRVGPALRARDATRPTEADLARAEQNLTIIRRGWTPPPTR